MAEFQRTQAEVDATLSTRRSGSVLLVVGWIFLGMAALTGVLNFSAVREGDSVWLTFTGVMAAIGLVLAITGTVVRSKRT
jgi:hypothetical protein